LKLAQPGCFEDQLTGLRQGARTLLAQAVETRSRIFSPSMLISRPRMAANALCATAICLSARCSQMALRQPRVRNREAAADDPGRIRFTPAILPPYLRRSKSIETLLAISI
jgi:putative transposase